MQNVDEAAQDGELRAEVRELSRRVGIMEQRLGAVEQRISSVEATLQHVATKADLYQALNTQTWKMAGFGFTMIALTFAIARYL